MILPKINGWAVPKGKTSSPAEHPENRQFIVTFIDDDASEANLGITTGLPDYPHSGGFFTRLHPVFVAANRYLIANGFISEGEEIAPCECVYTNNRLSTDLVNPSNAAYYRRGVMLKKLQDEYGWEIGNHSINHNSSPETVAAVNAMYNPEVIEAEVVEAKRILTEDYGFNIDSFIYPAGYQSKPFREKVLEHHKAGFLADGKFPNVTNHNIPPMNFGALARKTLDIQGGDATGNLINPTEAWAYFKSCVDQAKAANSWLITMSHCTNLNWKNYNALFPALGYPSEFLVPTQMMTNPDHTGHVVPAGWYPYPNSQLECLYKMIIYIYEQGGKVMLPRDAFEIYKNKRTVGDVTFGVQGLQATLDQLNYPHLAVGMDDSVTAYRD